MSTMSQNAPEIIAIAALGRHTRYICHDDQLLWRIPEDLQRLKRLTNGYPLIMGRKTYESIGRPLPQRTNIILTRDKEYPAPASCVMVTTPDAALSAAVAAPGGSEKIFIFGGAEIYQLFMPHVETLLLTLVDSDTPGTATFPEFTADFTAVAEEPVGYHEQNDECIPYQWVTYRRTSST